MRQIQIQYGQQKLHYQSHGWKWTASAGITRHGASRLRRATDAERGVLTGDRQRLAGPHREPCRRWAAG